MEVSSNPYVGPPTRNKISFLPVSLCLDQLISASKVATSFSNSPPGYEKGDFASNPIV